MSDEQLVRMGRNDLYRRGDTEIVNGRRVAKPGEDAVTVLTTTLTDTEFCCLYQRGGRFYQVKPNGRYGVGDHVHALDLVAIDPAPTLVPWEFSEIPVGHWFKHKSHATAFRVGRVSPKDGAVGIGADWTTPADMFATYEHSASHVGPFEPCGKYS